MLGLYRKRRYDNAVDLLRLITSKGDIPPQSKEESVSYDTYYQISNWCSNDRTNRKLFVETANPDYITLRLEIKATIHNEHTNS